IVLLWLMSLGLSARWIIFSAHSVGYTLLAASAILTFGVFSTFLQAWHQMRTLTGSVTSLKNQIKLVKEHESHSLAATVQLQRAMHEIADKHKHELECVAKAHAAKVQTVLKESNATLLALTQQRDQQRRHAQQLEAALDKETRRRIDADAAQAQLMARVERQNTRLAQLEIEGLRESVGKSSSI
ncbi:hypothetical protein B5M09_011382, partial [Aphanomyces astaci]